MISLFFLTCLRLGSELGVSVVSGAKSPCSFSHRLGCHSTQKHVAHSNGRRCIIYLVSLDC